MNTSPNIKGIKPENKAVWFDKQADGSAVVRLGSGKTFTVPADNLDLQAFIVFTMIHADEVVA